ncbi:MAG: ABATE domain-containing protein, partial [Alphaproteobacteria bacterium]|nr:ABATE domain-containing protein [Alphaproteobacteria bacterium]
MPQTVQPSYAEVPPNRVGGALALDFVNTVEWRGDPAARGERLTSYAELAHWAGSVGAVSPDAVSALLARAARDPDAAARVLADALALREAVARLAAGPAAPLP